jgi:TetR/AcrR family transcriptional regulator, transcriptional repressor of bet genes
MPKQVDHHARRLELLEALMRVTRGEGWDGVSLRKVAAEAGVSMGMVQHYFATKDEMLRFAIEMMAEDVRTRIRERVAGLPQPIPPRVLVETALSEMIPRPNRRSAEAEGAEVWMRRFLLRPEGRAIINKGNEDLKAGLITQILLARPGDQAGAERDAAALMALIDGLIFNIVLGLLDDEAATEILRGQLDYIFGGAT